MCISMSRWFVFFRCIIDVGNLFAARSGSFTLPVSFFSEYLNEENYADVERCFNIFNTVIYPFQLFNNCCNFGLKPELIIS